MKRFVTVCAVLGMVAGLAYLATADVKSVNAVGFVTVTGTSGEFKLVGPQFDDISGAATPTPSIVFGTNGIPNGLTVWIPQPAGNYNKSVFFNGSWIPDTDVIDRGMGVWFQFPAAGGTVKVTGEVPEATTDLVFGQGFQLFSYPFPAAQDLTNSFVGQNSSNGDTIWLPQPAGNYDKYLYFNGTWFGPGGADNFKFDPGIACWFEKAGAGTSTNAEPVPYTL